MAERQIDELSLLFGSDYVINDKLTVRQPTLSDIHSVGEEHYFAGVYTLTAIPQDLKYPLSVAGIDYEQISDFDLFVSLSHNVDDRIAGLIFGDGFSFRDFEPAATDSGPILVHKGKEIIIDSYIYKLMFDALCKVHMIVKKRRKAGNAFTKKMMIELDRQDRANAAGKPYKSQLRTLISSMVNYPGFSYNYETVQQLTYYQFMDAVERSQIYTSSVALLGGAYSGFCDTSKIDKNNFNWLREGRMSGS